MFKIIQGKAKVFPTLFEIQFVERGKKKIGTPTDPKALGLTGQLPHLRQNNFNLI